MNEKNDNEHDGLAEAGAKGDASDERIAHDPEAAPQEIVDIPADLWPDEDPDALPDVVQQRGAPEVVSSPSEELSQHSLCTNSVETSASAGNTASTPTSPTSPNEKSFYSVGIIDKDVAQEIIATDTARSEETSREGAPTEGKADGEKHGAPPQFPVVSGGILPPAEETQEVPGGQGGRKRRSFLSRLASALGWLLVLAVFMMIGLAALYYRYASDRLYNIQFETNRTVILRVAPGDRLTNIIEKLREEGLLGSYLGIDDAYLLKYLAWLNENSHKIKTGVYRLNSSMSLSEIYDKLIAGSQDFKITIPEGKTAKETAAIIKKKLDGFDEQRFLRLIEDPQFISKLGLSVPSLEGYLYPDTYFFAPGMKEEDIIRTMVENFVKRAEAHLKDIERTETSVPLTFHEHVIVASLIEREARLDAERPIIASVIFNRLKKGMKLDIDATINFALGDWGKRLTYEDLKTSSPYNTYLHKGLPPGPICNPQISSLVATFKPAQTSYLFYVYKGDGSHAFAETYEEHLANIRLYRKSSPGGRTNVPVVSPDNTALPSSVADATETTTDMDEDGGESIADNKSDNNNPRIRASSSAEKKPASGRRSRTSGNRK